MAAALKQIYERLFRAAIQGKTEEEIKKIKEDQKNLKELDCLLNPKSYPLILNLDSCGCDSEKQQECADRCAFDAITLDPEKGIQIRDNECIGCEECVKFCDAGKLVPGKDIFPTMKAVQNPTGPVYALVAPAFIGQFSNTMDPGKLRAAFKEVGFTGMIEVALFADILTLKEALEFDKNIVAESDYQLTSCCCPIWIGLIRKVYHELLPHVPGSVSPMIACGRTIKQLHPDATTVFIGPCLAKKAEAREPDLVGAIDFVLTFQEMKSIFEAMEIDPDKLEGTERDHSSRAGRIYAYSGGVSEAVKETVERLTPMREIMPITETADGVPACKQMIDSILAGETNANFFEGMGCVGGCVGGPKRILNKEEGKKDVKEYAKEATYPTPIDNPYVIELLHRLGFDTVEALLEKSDIFTREIK